jgi:hypothetical protein
MEHCWKGTPCDARAIPGFGVTAAPTGRPTAEALPYGSEENYFFCGTSWDHANACKTRWCGDGGSCPEGLR